MRDKSQLREMILTLLNSPLTLHSLAMANPLFASASVTLEEVMHMEAEPLAPAPSKFLSSPQNFLILLIDDPSTRLDVATLGLRIRGRASGT